MTEQQVIDWLLEEDQPSVRYYTLADLRGRKESDPEARLAHPNTPRTGWAEAILRLQKPGGYWEVSVPKPTNFREWVQFLLQPTWPKDAFGHPPSLSLRPARWAGL
jgi:hypothetical protein